MQILRSMLAIILGYAIFGVAAQLLFKLTGRDPHNPASFLFMLLATLYGAFFALVAGFAAGCIAGQRPLIHAISISTLLLFGAGISLILGSGSAWTMISTVVVSIPMTLVGAFAYSRLHPDSPPKAM